MEDTKCNEIFQECLTDMKNLYEALILVIEDSEYYDEYCYNFKELKTILNEQKILQQDTKLKSFLLMILNISNNHHRSSNFFNNIKEIIKYLEQSIKATFSNIDLFNLFISNKLILLFLFEEKIITFDKDIYQYFIKENESGDKDICNFFYPEIKNFSSNDELFEIENELIKLDPDYETTFFDKRRNGENDRYICLLIRNDEVEKFITYVNFKNIPLSTKIEPSIYETNLFLIDKNPTLIEYAAFYGSIQIFQYLLMNNVQIDNKKLWIYSVHSNNAGIIHLLESNLISINDKAKENVYLESIKCHHNQFCDYFENNLINRKIDIINDKSIKNYNIVSTIFKYHNYFYLPEDFENNYGFFYMYKYGYSKLVELFLNTKKIDEGSKTVFRNNIHIAYLILGKQTKIEAEEFKNCKLMRKFIIPPTIKRICVQAFERSSLTEIIIPSSVTDIGQYAFKGCSKLAKITFPSSVINIETNALSGCSSLKRITFLFPSSVTEIGYNNVISDCSSLTHITIPSSITEIRNYAFIHWQLLTHITIPSSVTQIGKHAFLQCKSLSQIIIPSSIIKIREYAFGDCTSLTKVTIHSSNTEIDQYAFSGCVSLIQIALPSSISLIGYDAFFNCPNILIEYPLKWIYQKKINHLYINASNIMNNFIPHNEIQNQILYITLLSNVKTIDNNAFSSFTRLRRITIPSSVTEIGDSAFSECSSLIQITIPSSVTKIGEKSFKNCSSLKIVELSCSLKKIEPFTFSNCKSLLNISIPDTVEEIYEYVFSECSSLVEIIIPENVKIIYMNAFEKCTSLRKVILPEKLEEIHPEVFLKCTSLDNISIPSSAKYIDISSFLNCPASKCVDYSLYDN